MNSVNYTGQHCACLLMEAEDHKLGPVQGVLHMSLLVKEFYVILTYLSRTVD
jgi:hypothetical protein